MILRNKGERIARRVHCSFIRDLRIEVRVRDGVRVRLLKTCSLIMSHTNIVPGLSFSVNQQQGETAVLGTGQLKFESRTRTHARTRSQI